LDACQGGSCCPGAVPAAGNNECYVEIGFKGYYKKRVKQNFSFLKNEPEIADSALN
jgi:hypothetical protein